MSGGVGRHPRSVRIMKPVILISRIDGGYAFREHTLRVGTIEVRKSKNPISNAVKCGEVHFVDCCKLLIYWLLR
jgi:hypothetical protein